MMREAEQQTTGGGLGTRDEGVPCTEGRDPDISRVLSLQFRLPGANLDYLVLGSDSGRVSVLEYSKARNQFERVHCEPCPPHTTLIAIPPKFGKVPPPPFTFRYLD